MAGNTGYKSYANLELYYLDDNSAAGQTKANTFGTDGYIAPVYDAATCSPTPRYYNTVRTLNGTRNNCGVGYTGQTVTMTAPANMFISTVSVADANSQADSYLSANVQAYANSYGNCAIASDTTPPTTPNLYSIGDFGAAYLALSWSTSTDASGINYYEVYRADNNSGIFAAIAQTSATSFQDYNIVNGNLYSYAIKAVDTAFNYSAFSNTQSYFY